MNQQKTKIYYYDHSGELEFPACFQRFTSIDNVEPDALIFAHVSEEEDEFVGFAPKKPISIIFISRVPKSLKKKSSWPENVSVCQRWSANDFKGKGASISETYGKKGAIHINTGLLPPPPPEYTVAAYLLLVAKKKGVKFSGGILGKIEKNGGEAFWTAVRRELDEQNVKVDSLPSNWETFKVNDMTACHESLRKSFPATVI